MGRILTTIDDDWLAVIGNIYKARQRWSNSLHILGREGVDARTSGQFYLIVIQEIMFFLEMVVVNPCIGRVLGCSTIGL